LLVLFFLAIPALCFAQASGGSADPFSGGRSAPQPQQQTQASQPGLVTRALLFIMVKQRQFHRKLAAELETIREHGAMAAGWALILTSFLYGILHAAGPGHGKAIMTTYLATHRQRMWRGILLSAIAATVQGITAIVLVFGLTTIAGLAARDTQSAVRWAEQFSYILVAAMGGYLAYRAAAGLRRSLRHGAQAAPMPAPALAQAPVQSVALDQDHSHVHEHTHDHAHGHDFCGDDHCGHSHGPTAAQLDAARDLKTMAGIVLSIGFRPCSGAVLVLAVANLFGIPWAGVAAVFAMSLGTAIAVASLALLVLSARHLVTTLAAEDSPAIAMAGQIVALLGGSGILLLGSLLFINSFGPLHPLGL
jgi:nickel/cobalt transporter (NicO) family protein